MSLAEIKEELRRLTPGDLADVERFAAELRRDADAGSSGVRTVHSGDPDVAAAEDAVFRKHRELLSRLAQ